jgi:hypothetical protein
MGDRVLLVSGGKFAVVTNLFDGSPALDLTSVDHFC